MSQPLSGPHGLSALEAAAGVVLGSGEPVSLSRAAKSPLEELERRILPALERPPCLVSFSGGRDSSAVLAVAARLARRTGLPLPIPATIRFRTADRTSEADWQEQVVAHAELPDWIRIELDDELDCIGPIATETLRRHGLFWPPNAHFHVPILRKAADGSLVTGVGGDEVLGSGRWGRAEAVLAGAARPGPRDALRVGLALSPPAIRRRVFRSRGDVPFPWLRPGARRAVGDALVRDAAAEPLRSGARLGWRLGQRYLGVGTEILGLLADDAEARIVHPLIDPGFCAALARLPRPARHGTRRDRMEAVFGDVLPPAVARRAGKAGFGQAAYGRHGRAFTARWDGSGVDPALVDPEALAGAWPDAERDGRLLTVLQAVWLGTEGRTASPAREGRQTVDSRVE